MFSKIAAVAVIVFFAVSPSMAAPSVEISASRGVYSVRARFAVAAPPEKVREVLTDYESIPEYSSSVIKSDIKSRAGNRALVEQTGVQKILPFFSVRARLLLNVEETQTVISFEDISGKDFRIYRGRWEITGDSSGSVVEYFLSARPAFYVPGFIANMVFAGKAVEMCRELSDEIDRRHRHILPRR